MFWHLNALGATLFYFTPSTNRSIKKKENKTNNRTQKLSILTKIIQLVYYREIF